MKTKIILTILFISLFSNICLAQPNEKGHKPPTIEERLKMINEKICQPLELDKNQSEKVNDAFKDFFVEMDKLIDFKVNPPRFPKKSKVNALAKIRDNKVKQVIPENLFEKYIELEKSARPPHKRKKPKK
jgi:uncharacterized protein YfkK (UPF0435 family)